MTFVKENERGFLRMNTAKPAKKNFTVARITKYKWFYVMFLPVFLMTLIFQYIPMIGIRYAFYQYNPFSEPVFIGMENFIELTYNANFIRAFTNTLVLSLVNLVITMVVSIFFAILMNEIYTKVFKSFVQTVLYLPHFISWVVTASIFALILSPDHGLINEVLGLFGVDPVYFLANESMWRPIYYFINRWKETGWNTIIYLAAISGINAELYEAAAIDGAGKIRQTISITIPSIMTTILVVFILNLAKVLNIFESVFVLQNPLVLDVSEVIQTYVYKKGLIESNYGYSTAVGLFRSVISMVLVMISDWMSKKIKGEGIL